jgi:hypothetical protein
MQSLLLLTPVILLVCFFIFILCKDHEVRVLYFDQ